MRFKAIISTALMAATAVWSFASGGAFGGIAPQATQLAPAESAIDVPLSQAISVSFTRPINPQTINPQTFLLQQRGMPVFGSVAYRGNTATFTPAVLLSPLTRYTAKLTNGVRGISGARLAGEVLWNFTTGPQISIEPQYVSSPQLPVNLNTAAPYVALAGSAVTFSGAVSTITGDVGLSPTTGAAITAVTAPVVNGTIYSVDGMSALPDVMDPVRLTAAKNDLTTAYNDAAGRVTPDGIDLNGANLGGLTLAPGLYKFTTSALISGSNLTLSGPATGVWIFQIGTTLDVATGIQVVLTGGATWDNVFWQVGTSVTTISGSHMEGTILADSSVTIGTGATMTGRALARNGAVTFNGGFIGGLPSACATLAPATLSAAAGVPTGVSLSWAAVAGSTSYNIYRATVSGGPYTLVGSAVAPTTTYTDATALPAVRYYYVVRAFNLCESANSPEASFLAPGTCTTLAPATLSARQNDGSYTGIGLTWSAVVGATSYNIYRSTVSGGPYVIIQSVPGTATTYNDLSVQQGVVYFYVVRAMTACLSGNSPQAGAIRSRC